MITNDILKCASDYYKNQLYNNQNCNEAKYLKERNLSCETIKIFGIGISPSINYNKLINHLEKNNFSKQDGIEYGVLIDNYNNRPNDNMNCRVVIEIKDYKGNLIGFGGRHPLSGTLSKYVNTPRTKVFNKKDNLFNLDKAKYYINYLEKFNYIILVEGYFDVMSLWDKGIKNVVAPLGTALTSEQCKLIRMFTDNVVVCFDGDIAGQNAIKKSISLLKENKLNPIPMILPNNLDADDVVQKIGIDTFKNILDKSIQEYKKKGGIKY